MAKDLSHQVTVLVIGSTNLVVSDDHNDVTGRVTNTISDRYSEPCPCRIVRVVRQIWDTVLFCIGSQCNWLGIHTTNIGMYFLVLVSTHAAFLCTLCNREMVEDWTTTRKALQWSNLEVAKARVIFSFYSLLVFTDSPSIAKVKICTFTN